MPGAEVVDEGRNTVLFGTTNSDRGENPSIVKILAPRKLVIELCCATLGRAMSLPVPVPLIVHIVPSLNQFLGLNKQCFALGSIDGKYPSYGSRFRDS